MKPILSCTGLHKSFAYPVVPTKLLQDYVLRPIKHAERWSVHAVNDVSLTLKSGEWVGLYGPNASGKTTLLRMLGGLLRQDKGTVECSATLSCFFTLGVGFHPERLADENIYFHGLFHGLSRKEINDATEKIIDFAGVQEYRHLPIKCYSQGMQMRLAYAAAAYVDSDVYLFDEVLAVGDAAFQIQCEEHMHSMKRDGKSAIIVAHTESSLEQYCDRILYIKEGSIVGQREMQHTSQMV